MKTHYLQPDQKVSTYVKYILVMEDDSPGLGITALPFYADGCPGIIYQQSEKGTMMQGEAQKLAHFFLYGQTVKPIEMLPGGRFGIIIFCLYSHVMKSLFGIDSHELTDDCLDLGLLPGAVATGAVDRLQHAPNAEKQIRIITNFLFELINQYAADVDHTMYRAVHQIQKSNGTVPLKTVREQLNITERTFERRFRHQVGISPKMYARIAQFQSSLHQLADEDYTKLSDVAYQNGYADQSHFIRTFKEFTGFTPKEYLANFGRSERRN